VNDDRLAEKACNILIVTEGFPTYGGLAGRDLEAFASSRIVDEDDLKYRIRRRPTWWRSRCPQVPVFKPAGGHAAFLTRRPSCPISRRESRQALACALTSKAASALRDRQRHVRLNRPRDRRSLPAMPRWCAWRPAPRLYLSHTDYGRMHRELFARRGSIRVCASPGSRRYATSRPASSFDFCHKLNLALRFPAVAAAYCQHACNETRAP
jgi:hypothetical protein